MTDIVQRAKLTLKHEDAPVGQAPAKEVPITGEARVETDGIIETASVMPASDKAVMLRFMEEKLVIMVHPSSDPSDPAEFIQVGNDGIQQVIPRGRPFEIKRKFVDSLMRGRNERLDQQVGKDANGEPYNRLFPRASMKYPFDVVQDTDAGRAWVRQKMAEAI